MARIHFIPSFLEKEKCSHEEEIVHTDLYSLSDYLFYLRLNLHSYFTWVIVGVRHNKDLKNLIIPFVFIVGYVKTLLPNPTIWIVKWKNIIHIQHLKRKTALK